MQEGGRREIFMMVPVVFVILPISILFATFPGRWCCVSDERWRRAFGAVGNG